MASQIRTRKKEVIFRQQHTPGAMGISDYTWANELNITLAGSAFKHKLYHYRLVFSGWTYVEVILGGESFESLSSAAECLLAKWGVPKTHRTDSLSAAFKKPHTSRSPHRALHQVMSALRCKSHWNNKGIAHENGAIEGPNGHLKRKIAQQLLLRESRDFLDLKQYRAFIDAIVAKINRQCHTRYIEECAYLSALPVRRTNDFVSSTSKWHPAARFPLSVWRIPCHHGSLAWPYWRTFMMTASSSSMDMKSH